MEEIKLKEVMEKVQIKKEMEEEIMKNVMNFKNENGQAGKNVRRRMKGWQGKVAAAAIALAVVGVGGITTYAIVGNPVKARMESMAEEEKKALVKEIDESTADATTYSRDFTKNELARQRELTMAYNKGRFPKKTIKRVKSEEQVDKDTLCCDTYIGYVYFPDRELTDEEFLQIIDYNHKVDYALQERAERECPEYTMKEEKEAAKKQIKEKGGISEEQAIAKAEQYLKEEYGMDSDGMEIDCCAYLPEDSPIYQDEKLSDAVYYVSCDIQCVEEYYFVINSKDGSLLFSDSSKASDLDK